MTIRELIKEEKFPRHFHVRIGHWSGQIGYLLDMNYYLLDQRVSWWEHKGENRIAIYR